MKKLEEFCKKYHAEVGPSQKLRARYKKFFAYSESDPGIFQSLPYETQPCVEIHMPEDSFRALLEHDEWLSQIRARGYVNHYADHAVAIVEQHEQECRARHENPAVQRAYEEYLMLLKLSGH